MKEETGSSPPVSAPAEPVKPRRQRRRAAFAAALVGAAAIGAGVTALAQRGPATTFVALTPAPITAMQDGNPVAVKGQVAEVFGNKFILADQSGRALIETGRRGEGAALVEPSETITVQGRFEHGFIHAAAIQHDDGRTVFLDPPPPPRPPRQPLG